jgi:polygalacturonase
LISFDVNPIKENRCENVVISDFNISNPECRVNSELWILFWGDTEYDCDCVNVDSYCNNNHCSKRPDGIKFNLR